MEPAGPINYKTEAAPQIKGGATRNRCGFSIQQRGRPKTTPEGSRTPTKERKKVGEWGGHRGCAGNSGKSGAYFRQDKISNSGGGEKKYICVKLKGGGGGERGWVESFSISDFVKGKRKKTKKRRGGSRALLHSPTRLVMGVAVFGGRTPRPKSRGEGRGKTGFASEPGYHVKGKNYRENYSKIAGLQKTQGKERGKRVF